VTAALVTCASQKFSEPKIIPVDKFRTAIRVTLSYKVNRNATEQDQLSQFGFVFDRATEQQKNMVKKISVRDPQILMFHFP
jgi:hypothetical protein